MPKKKVVSVVFRKKTRQKPVCLFCATNKATLEAVAVYGGSMVLCCANSLCKERAARHVTFFNP